MITHCECNSGFVLKSTANDDYIESNEQLDKCVKFDVREDSTVGVKIAELLRLNVSTSIDEQFSLKVQKTAEVHRTQFIDRVVNIPVVQLRQVPAVQVVQKIVEIHRFSTNGADGTEDRGDYTSAVLGQGCRDAHCGATPGVHGSDGAENSWS